MLLGAPERTSSALQRGVEAQAAYVLAHPPYNNLLPRPLLLLAAEKNLATPRAADVKRSGQRAVTITEYCVAIESHLQ